MGKEIELDLHFTNLCNLKCGHCLYESGEDIGDVPVEVLNRMVTELGAMGANTVHIGGGEPLTRYKDLKSFVHAASNAGVKPRLITNGLMLSEDKLLELMDHGLEELLVSLDGTEVDHNKFRKNDRSYQKAVNAIELGLKHDIFTRINSVLTSENKDDLQELLKYTSQLPVAVHAVLCLSPMGRGQEIRHLIPDFSYVGQFINEVRELAETHGFPHTKVQIQKGYLEPEVDEAHSHCRIDRKNNALIYSTGQVFPCVRFSQYGTPNHTAFSLGNIMDESITDIWSATNERWNLFNRDLDRDEDCPDQNCQGGCRGLMLAETGNINACDYRCDAGESGKLPSCIRKYVVVSDPQKDKNG